MDASQQQIWHFRALLGQGHIPLQPNQSDGVMETGWIVTQPSASPDGSITLIGPQPQSYQKNAVLSLARAIPPKHHSFPFPAPSWAPSIPWDLPADGRQPLAEVFASHRGPGQQRLAIELLGPIQTAERCPPSSPAPSQVIPTGVPAPDAALSQSTQTGGCGNTLRGFAACKEVDKEERLFS